MPWIDRRHTKSRPVFTARYSGRARSGGGVGSRDGKGIDEFSSGYNGADIDRLDCIPNAIADVLCTMYIGRVGRLRHPDANEMSLNRRIAQFQRSGAAFTIRNRPMWKRFPSTVGAIVKIERITIAHPVIHFISYSVWINPCNSDAIDGFF